MKVKPFISALILGTVSFLFFHASVRSQSPPATDSEPQDLKVIFQKTDSRGYIHRKIQYKKGGVIVTEETIVPPMPSLADRTKFNIDTMNLDSILVLVEKKDYNVAVLYKRRRIRQYRAVFGPDRLHDKMQEGDRKTPLGHFRIVAIKPHYAWKKFLLLDYPNAESFEKFNEYKAEGAIPTSAHIGSAVGIHGTAANANNMVDMGLGWTDGCVSLKYSDMDDFCQFVKVGTRVIIRN